VAVGSPRIVSCTLMRGYAFWLFNMRSVGGLKAVCNYIPLAWESTGWSIFAAPAVLETSVNL
jgi:hypothetical protein